MGESLMKNVKLVRWLFLIFFLGLGFFLAHSWQSFIVEEGFRPVPLSFDPEDSRSSYNWNGAPVEIIGGFVKGKLTTQGSEQLILRSLSPTPVITLKAAGDAARKYQVQLENINPHSTRLGGTRPGEVQIVGPHTVLLTLRMGKGERRTITVTPNDEKDFSQFVVMGDNRNGYATFSSIITQINTANPIFAIDNGDLVFGGDPNRYRLFYETISKLEVPLYTTLGNHDIRKGGRSIYTALFGPAYYSFSYRGNHFVFLDSSRGWADKQAIPEEQYKWLEKDLKHNQDKRIFVISHIPPRDIRSFKLENTFPNQPGVEMTSVFERIMNNYTLYKAINHGFPDRGETLRFENLMAKYKVNTVFLSHIHSYQSYVKDNVRYLVSGGAGAELLTTESFYHYLRVTVAPTQNYLEMVELPSPANTLQDRYMAAVSLFAVSIYKEYKSLVIMFFIGLLILLGWALYITFPRWWRPLRFLGRWLGEVVVFAVKKFLEMRRTKV